MGLYINGPQMAVLVFIIMLADILGITGSYLLALWARFDFHFMDIPPEFLQGISEHHLVVGADLPGGVCSCATSITASGGLSAWTH